GSEVAQAVTNASGQATAKVPFGAFVVETTDEHYEVEGNSTFETASKPQTVELRLRQKFIEVTFEVEPPAATVSVSSASDGPRTVPLDARGRASARFAPGRYQVTIEAQGYAPWMKEYDFPRQPDPFVVQASLGAPVEPEDPLSRLARQPPEDIDAALLAALDD